MSRKIYAQSSQFVPPSTAKLLHSGAGKVRALIATNESTTSAAVVLYDGVTAGGALLISCHLTTAAPLVVLLPEHTPIVFQTGLYVATGAGVRTFLITEAQG